MICETQFFWGGRGGGASLFPTSVRRYPSVLLGGVKKIQSNDPAKGRTSLSEFYCLKASKMYGLLVIFVFFAGVILFMVRLRCLSMSWITLCWKSLMLAVSAQVRKWWYLSVEAVVLWMFLVYELKTFYFVSIWFYSLDFVFSGVMAGSPCPIEVMKQVITKLHMPQVTVNSNMFEQKMTSRQLHSVGQLVDQASCQSVILSVS